MTSEPISSLAEHFANVTHQLFNIIAIAILGTICGADGWVEIEQFLFLPKGIPSHDTFGRVFAQIDPEKFQTSFQEWVQALHQVTQGQLIGIAGKQRRGSHAQRQGQRALYLVSAWAEQNHLVLGQRQVATNSNEITAKGGIKAKRLQAGWNEDYLLKVLAG